MLRHSLYRLIRVDSLESYVIRPAYIAMVLPSLRRPHQFKGWTSKALLQFSFYSNRTRDTPHTFLRALLQRYLTCPADVDGLLRTYLISAGTALTEKLMWKQEENKVRNVDYCKLSKLLSSRVLVQNAERQDLAKQCY
jgi:hypothetical protein